MTQTNVTTQIFKYITGISAFKWFIRITTPLRQITNIKDSFRLFYVTLSAHIAYAPKSLDCLDSSLRTLS